MTVNQETAEIADNILYPSEWIILSMIFLLLLLDMTLLASSNASIDWTGYTPSAFVGATLLCIGVYYRRYRSEPRIGLSFVAGGSFILFALAAQMLNYLMLPHRISAVDLILLKIDETLGYSWASFVEWGAENPRISIMLGLVYLTSLPQSLVAIIALATRNRISCLHRLMLTAIVSFLIATIIWWAMPTSGPATVVALDPEVAATAHLVVGPDYGIELVRLGSEGPSLISPRDALGLIAFPSYHLVMALLAIWYTRQMPWVFIPLLILNVPMLPAILLHGGHHLVDLIGGVLVFLAAAGISKQVVLRASSRGI